MPTSPDNTVLPFQILITGDKPGTGATTAARTVSELLRVPLVSGGKFYRAVANRFQAHCEAHPDYDRARNYVSFLEKYQHVFDTQGLSGIDILIAEGFVHDSNSALLRNFDEAIAEHSAQTGSLDKVWDYIVDQKTLETALKQPGYVLESKLAIVLFEIAQFQEIIAAHTSPKLPPLHILLTASTDIAAQRVGQRENTSGSDVIAREQRIFSRYSQLYTYANGQAINHQYLPQAADLTIHTDEIKSIEVVAQILEAYLQKLNIWGQEQAVLAQPAIEHLSIILASFPTHASKLSLPHQG